MVDQIFYIPPQFQLGFSYTYEFASTIAKKTKLGEQRRPITEASALNSSGTYHTKGIASQKMFNDLSYMKDKLIAVPVQTEKLNITLIGANSIQVSDNLNLCFNLRQKDSAYLILTDCKDKKELKQIARINITSMVIEFTENITESFTLNDVWAYPVVISTIRAISKVDETDSFDVWKIDFQGINTKINRLILTSALYPIQDIEKMNSVGVIVDSATRGSGLIDIQAESIDGNQLEVLTSTISRVIYTDLDTLSIEAVNGKQLEVLSGSVEWVGYSEVPNSTPEAINGKQLEVLSSIVELSGYVVYENYLVNVEFRESINSVGIVVDSAILEIV